ncbi:conjugal transfer protein [Komagataeibacter oboediens]|uniref:Conjugal transfer protein n=1 Tax=Komagataeibacter oboediens TaxID=65958 RepID=A0A318R261_9PROT|nr:TrbI/VirB10 family protein [Komagataeibacter oboediens]PYD79753.1 conjugal transfer protein [Komagataeibacter oboediens]
MKPIKSIFAALMLMPLPIPAMAQMAFPSGAIASKPVPAAMLANGARLKEGIARLNAQWQEQTGEPLVTASDLAAGGQTNSQDEQAQQDDDDDDDQPDTKAGKRKVRLKQRLEKASQDTDDFTPGKIGDRYKIPVGYMATGTLEMTANSDHPGPFKGELTQPILSIDRQHVLFPAGSIVTGQIMGIGGGTNSVISNRITFVPLYITRPDGGSMRIRGQNVLDRFGINGVGDKTNYHIAPMLGAAIGLAGLQSIPSILSNITQKSNTFNTVGQEGAEEIQQGGQNTLQQYMNLRPTTTVRAGHVPIHIFFNREQFAPEWRATDNFQLTNVSYKGATK